MVGIHLHFRPREIILKPCIFCLNTDEIGVTGGYALPGSFSSVVAPSSSDHKVSAVPAKAKLGEGTRKTRLPRFRWSPIDKGVKAGHVSILWPYGVVTQNA